MIIHCDNCHSFAHNAEWCPYPKDSSAIATKPAHSNWNPELKNTQQVEFRPLMTGQEWYDRFEKEMMGFEPAFSSYPEGILIAARKASGIGA